MTKKGWIYIGFMYSGGEYEHTIQEAWRGAHCEGDLISYVEDLENNHTLWLIHRLNKKLHLSIMYKSEL